MRGIYRTKGINPENGKPNVIAFMFSEEDGISLRGGAMALGVSLTFGDAMPFRPEQWEELSEEEYLKYIACDWPATEELLGG